MKDDRAPYPAWIYRQSAVLPYRLEGESLRVMLITSRSGKRWVIPKGIVDPGLGPVESALKEAREEAGVDGLAGGTPLGAYRYRKWGGTCEVDVYPLEVASELDDWPEAQTRRRQWFGVRDAVRRVEKKGLGRIIERLPEALSQRRDAAPVDAPGAAPPTRLVYLFRHAKSSWSDETLADEDRPLAPRGERACEAMSRYISLADVHPGLVVCSSALRTRQTLERVMPAIGEGATVATYRGLYGASPQAMLERLRATPDDVDSVMLVGHMPGIQTLAIRLAGSGDATERERLATRFPTAALAILIYRGATWGELDTNGCELHSHVWPREIGQDPDAAKRARRRD